MADVEISILHRFLNELGHQYPAPAILYLLGGSALHLLGSSRPTLDIDYVGDDVHKDHFQQAIEEVAHTLQLDIEAVPIEQFIPLLSGAKERALPVGRFGKVDVYIFDPYTIAFSKLDRGFDTDIADIVFLARSNLIDLMKLESLIADVLPAPSRYDLSPNLIRQHLNEVYRQVGA